MLSNSKENPSSGAFNTRRVDFFAILDLNRRLSRKRYEMGSWLLWNVNRKSWVADRSLSVSMTLSNHERRNARGQIISQADFLNNARSL